MWRNCLPSPAYRRGRQLQPEQALTQSEAVRAAAVTAAASLGVPDAAGLAPGHPADLVVCDGDPVQPRPG